MCQKLEKIIQLASITFNRTSPEFKANLHNNVELLSSKVQELTGEAKWCKNITSFPCILDPT